MTARPVIALVGCGKMGSAMLRGWIAGNVAQHIYVVEPSGLPAEFSGITCITPVADTGQLPAADVVVLAVKPQSMADVCRGFTPHPTALILSVAAGQKIADFESAFGATQPVIRTMPNTPAAIAKGISAAIANANVTPGQKNIADGLLQAIGDVVWVQDESLMDAVTAVSGSGPAYVFYLIEVLAKSGAAAGLDPAFAMTLARQTVIGSAALAESEPDLSAATLRQNVTSPGGTTEAALKTLMNGEMQDIFDRAIMAATMRSKDLSS